MAQFRGRGTRGRGSQGQGRGMGRGGFRGSKRSSFQTARLEVQSEEDSDNNNDAVSKSEEPVFESDDDSSSESQEENINPVQPYRSLLESLNIQQLTNGRAAKRRKLFQPVDDEPRENNAEALDSIGSPEKGNVDVDPSGETADLESDGYDDQEDQLDSDDELVAEGSDPFDTHFANPEEDYLIRRIKAIAENNWTQSAVPSLIEKTTSKIPSTSNGHEPQTMNMNPIASPRTLKLKSRLVEPFQKLQSDFTDLESSLAAPIFGNRDVFFTARDLSNAESFRRLTCLHALNHIFKTRDRVIKNNARLARDGDDLELRDQGFTRPKVLMLLPTRQSCVKMANIITSLSDPEQQENRKRFQDGFISTDVKFSDDKPEDFRDLFGGNDDDMFRLGMKFTRKTIKYFSQFYNSDIILASPLGLRMAIGDEEDKKQDYDFLSSIEIVVIDQTDALLMQNWEHVEYIFEHLNLQPKEAHGCDFSRVRSWYLDGNAKYLRQIIVATAFTTPELNGLTSKHMKNVEGLLKLSNTYEGAILDLGLRIKQTFSRFDFPSLVSEPDARFKYFTSAILPNLTRHKLSSSAAGQGILIFVQSYLDFVRIRNHFSTSSATQNLSFGSLSEYSSSKEVARARSHFYSGRHSILLYTGRAHHFRRYALRGVKQIIMYSLPDDPIFYCEIVGGYLRRSVADGNAIESDVSVRSIFSKRDALSLERIVGSTRYRKMLLDQGGDTFEFL